MIKPTNKKVLGASGIPRPFKQPPMQTAQNKPAVAQRKTVAPPVYCPQRAPKAVQAKMANATVKHKSPVAPPVYNPYSRQTTVQAKTVVGPHSRTVSVKHPVGPPAYKPQPLPKVLQTKLMAASGKTNVPAPIAKRLSPNKPQHVITPVQKKVMQAKPNAGNTIQREIRFEHGPRLRIRNPADTVSMRGNTDDYGLTMTTLNGRRFPGGDEKAFVAALVEPALLVERTADGFAVSVHSVAVQRLSYIMELPRPGPWQLQAEEKDAKEIARKLGGVLKDEISIPPGPLTLRVRGLPTDANFADMVETHEEKHVYDIEVAVNAVLRPWDAKLNQLRRDRVRFLGPDQKTATARLYAAAGGTPEEFAQRFTDMLKAMGKLFHRQPQGEMPDIINLAQDGSTLEVSLQHAPGLSDLHEQRSVAEAKGGSR